MQSEMMYLGTGTGAGNINQVLQGKQKVETDLYSRLNIDN